MLVYSGVVLSAFRKQNDAGVVDKLEALNETGLHTHVHFADFVASALHHSGQLVQVGVQLLVLFGPRHIKTYNPSRIRIPNLRFKTLFIQINQIFCQVTLNPIIYGLLIISAIPKPLYL